MGLLPVAWGSGSGHTISIANYHKRLYRINADGITVPVHLIIWSAPAVRQHGYAGLRRDEVHAVSLSTGYGPT